MEKSASSYIPYQSFMIEVLQLQSQQIPFSGEYLPILELTKLMNDAFIKLFPMDAHSSITEFIQMLFMFSQSMLVHWVDILKTFGFKGVRIYSQMVIHKIRQMWPSYEDFHGLWEHILKTVWDKCEENSHTTHYVERWNKYYILLEVLARNYLDSIGKTVIWVEKPIDAIILFFLLSEEEIYNNRNTKVDLKYNIFFNDMSNQNYLKIPQTHENLGYEIMFKFLNEVIWGTHINSFTDDDLFNFYSEQFQNHSGESVMITTEFPTDINLNPGDKIMIFNANKFTTVPFSPIVQKNQIWFMHIRDQHEDTKRKITRIDRLMKKRFSNSEFEYKDVKSDAQ